MQKDKGQDFFMLNFFKYLKHLSNWLGDIIVQIPVHCTY